MDRCIEHCLDCFVFCSKTITHCLAHGEDERESEQIKVLLTCAIITDATAKLMLADSTFHEEACRLCAMVCRDCAQDCQELCSQDEAFGECAALCLACAESCEAMTAH